MLEEVQSYVQVLDDNKPTLTKNKGICSEQIKKLRKETKKGQAYRQNKEEVKGVYQDAVECIVVLVQEECNDDELAED